MLPIARVAGLVLLLLAGSASAMGGHQHDHGPNWTFDPLVTVPLGLLLLVFCVGFSRLSSRSTIARRAPWSFVAGWLVLTLSLVSPLHQGGEASFTLHMIEHELIMLVATFLLAASRAGGMLAWGLPAAMRRRLSGSWKAPFASLWRRLTEPVTATVIQAVVMWAWHAPALFDRTLTSQGWHVAQHMSFILASLIFWSAMLQPRRGGYLLSAACLFATSLVEGALGALMALSTSPWYAAYAAMGLSGIGLDPTTDQQLAGLIMWVPGGLIHGGAALVMLYAALKAGERNHAISAS
jgi:putative membrane protein